MSKPVTIPLLVIFITVLIYGGFELYMQSGDPENTSPEVLIEKSLNRSEKLFNDLHDRFAEQSYQLKAEIESRLAVNPSRQVIHGIMESYPFWGSSVYRNGNLYTWDGYALPSLPEIPEVEQNSLYIDVFRLNNVIYLLGKISFTIADEDNFTLITTRRLSQHNVIPIAREQEYNLAQHPELKDYFPVHFTFFDPAPHPLNYYRTLKTADSDSVGIVYAEDGQFDNYISTIDSTTSRWRTLFHIFFFLLGSILFFTWSYSFRSWRHLIFQLTGIFALWIVFARSEMPVAWITHFLPELSAGQLNSLQAISYYAIHSVFTFFATFSITATLTKKWNLSNPEKHYKTFFISFIFGGLNVVLILFFLITTYNTASEANIALIDLELIPDLATGILFVATGFFVSSVAALLISTWWFLFVSEKDKSVVIGLIGVVSFILFYFIADQLIDFALFEPWKFLLSIGLFGISLSGAAYIYRYPESFLQLSGFRLLLLVALLTSATGYIIYSITYSENRDIQLLEAAEDYADEEDYNVREVVFDLLSSIEQRMILPSQSDLRDRLSTIQAQFQRAIQSSLRDEWRAYSYDIQLIDAEGNLISDYATNFDSPGTGFYNILGIRASYRQEQIRRDTNRPIVQERPAALPRDRYITFYRGWIPIYDDTETNRIIAWIVAAVYVERPDFNKPIRAVLAASTVDDWRTSYYLSEFKENRLNRSYIKGIYANQPKYNRLPEREITIAGTDSIAFISNITTDGKFRELLLKYSDDTILKASTPVPGFNNHMFSFFRFNVVILTFGLILFPFFSLLGLKTFSLFGQSRKFRSRLLDGLVLTTLLFLIVLIASTQYAVSHQNESNLQREIITKLDNLADVIRTAREHHAVQDPEFIQLSQVATSLDADAIFYQNQLVTESTTPQIFQQNLLPRILPYPVHDFLFNRQRNHIVRTIDIGDETLMIGYRLIQSEQNEPLGVVAIPTFLQSPIYMEQLLETTSYLLVLYLIIFGVFIIATVIISNSLTRPLQFIQEGLNKISGGNLETKIPVKSKDEIGSLSNAYNIMVRKLKELQINLAEAEREAAWKEMAQQVAHEIKNPLTPMKLNLQHLRRQLDKELDNPEQFKKNVERVTHNIVEQIESLNKIASDFSKFAKPIPGEFTDVEVNELIQSVVSFYEPDSPGNIRHELHPQPLFIKGSNDELRRTLINLVKNSFEATGNDAHLVIRSSRNKTTAVIEVEDNGAGIAAEDKDKIFVPNFSTKSSGTGLGLAITKKIIDAHKGTISFSSEVGEGTTFRIEIPLNGKKTV